MLLSLHKVVSKLDPVQPLSVLTGTGLVQVRCFVWKPNDSSIQPELQLLDFQGLQPPGVILIGFAGVFLTQSPP